VVSGRTGDYAGMSNDKAGKNNKKKVDWRNAEELKTCKDNEKEI